MHARRCCSSSSACSAAATPWHAQLMHSSAPAASAHQHLASPRRLVAAVATGEARRRRHLVPVPRAAPFDGREDVSSFSSSSQSNSSRPDGSSSGPPGGGSSSGSSSTSQAVTPRALTPDTAQRLQQLTLQLLPQPHASTPLAPVLSLLLPALQPHLSALPPAGLLALLRVCNWAGGSPSAAWLQAWAAGLHEQLPRVSAQDACWTLSEVLRLQQPQLPQGCVDDLLTAFLRQPEACNASSLAAAMNALALASLQHRNAPEQQQQPASSSSYSSSSSAANVTLAAWRSDSSKSSSSGASLDVSSSLCPLAVHCLLEELGRGDRLAQLQPAELAGVAAAAAALQAKLPPGWLDRLFGAVEQQLPQLSGAALTLAATALPVLIPAGGNLRLWRQLGAAVQAQGGRLTAEQLCEVLPLVQAADLPLPVAWLQQAMDTIQAALPRLSLPQSSRALVAAVALGHTPAPPWLAAYLPRLAAQLSELASDGLVGVLRALAAAGALPGREWLEAFERDLQRRFGFVGPVELSSSAFLLANLGHTPSDAWCSAFLSETLKFKDYYTGADLTQVVWSAVRLNMQPDQAWLEGFAAQFVRQVGRLQAYQLAFTFAALQKLGAPLDSASIDQVLDAFSPALPRATPSDTALLLVTVARLQHVTSYAWLQGLLDHVQDHMLAFDGQELVTLLWSLAQLHHQPGPEWLAIFFEASEAHLPACSGSQLAQLGYALASLAVPPPPAWMDSFLNQCQLRMAADGMGGTDAASLLASLATLQHTPSEEWLHTALTLLHWKGRELDPEGLASVATSLVQLAVVISNGPWLEGYVSLASSRLASMAPATQANLLAALAVWKAQLPPAWVAMFQLLCVKQAEEGSMAADQLEQVLVALSALGLTPSTALAAHFFDASLPLLPRTSADSIAAVLTALQDARLQPDTAWLEAAVAAVRLNIRQYSVLQLNGVARALAGFEGRSPRVENFLSYLKEFFLY